MPFISVKMKVMTDVQTIRETMFSFPGQTNSLRGSVRDLYIIQNKLLVMVTTDRISTFDVVMPVTIPFKGQVLSQIAAKFLSATQDIVPNWMITAPDPNVMIGHLCEPYKIEVVVRCYLTGHAWREYRAGKREVSGVKLPNGMREHDKFPKPIITPATHAETGHDEDISKDEIIKQGLIPAEHYEKIEEAALKLYARGSEMAKDRGLILVDTKYEFGLHENNLLLMDEVHTPDSSRYFYAEGYQERQEKGEPQKQLSKEFVREWLMERGYQGRKGEELPDISEKFISEVSERYVELYEQLTGEKFVKPTLNDNYEKRIESATIKALEGLDD